MENIEFVIKDTLAKTLCIMNHDEIQLNHHLRKDLRLDSMSSLMFLMRLEERINGFFVDPETLGTSDLETVASIIHYVQYQMRAKSEYVH